MTETGGMNGRNGCEANRDLLMLRATAPLEAAEEARVRRHLDAGCPRCLAAEAEAREVADLLPWALPPEEPSEVVRARILARARGEAEDRRRPAGAPRPGLGLVAAAAALAAVISSLLTANVLDRRHSVETALLWSRIEKQQEELVGLRRQVLQARDAVRLAGAPGVRVFDLKGQKGLQASARVFWDPSATGWQMFTAALPAPPAGRTYQLWLITAKRKVSAGVFDAGGAQAAGSAAVPVDAGPVVAAAVTDEPAGGSPQPTGSILLLGAK